MTEKPILMNTEMVQATLDNRKTQTRRTIKNVEYHGCLTGDCPHEYYHECTPVIINDLSPYNIGDHLYVRETHYVNCSGYEDGTKIDIVYKASDPDWPYTWTPSIHMPKWAARIWLKVTNVRVERVQDISEEDALKEGIESLYKSGELNAFWGRRRFQKLWNSVSTPETNWNANPWVFVYDFERIEK